jgi:hypothetical protein
MTIMLYLLTVHHHPHILDKTVDNLEGLRRCYPSLIQGKSIQPLDDRFDILLSKKLLDKFFCVAVSQVL